MFNAYDKHFCLFILWLYFFALKKAWISISHTAHKNKNLRRCTWIDCWSKIQILWTFFCNLVTMIQFVLNFETSEFSLSPFQLIRRMDENISSHYRISDNLTLPYFPVIKSGNPWGTHIANGAFHLFVISAWTHVFVGEWVH